jgi:Ca2+-dependent lipid-binding protein
MHILRQGEAKLNEVLHPHAPRVSVRLIEGTNMPMESMFSKADPYVILSMGGKTYKSKTLSNQTNPKWNETVRFLKI